MSTRTKLRLSAAFVVAVGSSLIARPATASPSLTGPCSTAEWVSAADALADHCIGLGQGYSGAIVQSCESNGSSLTISGACRMAE